MLEGRGQRVQRGALGAIAALALGATSAFLACTTTPDPREGLARPSTSGGTSGSAGAGGAGLDAAAPSGPIDCGPAPVSTAAFSKQELLSAAARCAAWHTCGFQNAATSLRTALRDQAAAPAEDKRASAQAAWRGAMSAWSAMELFQLRPVATGIASSRSSDGTASPAMSFCRANTSTI